MEINPDKTKLKHSVRNTRKGVMKVGARVSENFIYLMLSSTKTYRQEDRNK